MNRLAAGVLDRANELSAHGVKGIDSATIGVVGDEQCVAQRSKVLGCHGEAPRLVQRRALNELLQEHSFFAEDVNETTRGPRRTGKSNIDQATEILNADCRPWAR